MPTIYHNSDFDIPDNWIKNEEFNAYTVNEQNLPWNEGIDQGTQYQLISKYEQHYGILARIARVVFGIMLSLIVISFAFNSGRELIKDLLFNSIKNIHIIRKINGGYEQLPEGAQSKNGSVVISEDKGIDQLIHLEEIKKIRCPIARETRIATMKGFYITPSGKKIHLRSGEQLLEGSRSVSNSVLEAPMQPKYEEFKIRVINQDCLEAAENELRNGAKKVAVLMLASPIEPGGGMEDGNNGQEEDLCRRSDIFGFMWDQSHLIAKTSLYNLVDVNQAHQVNPEYSKMKNNRMIHVPNVTVFRSGKTDNYKMLEMPFEVGMLVSPGLDRPGYEKVSERLHYKRAEDENQLHKLIMTQLKVSYEENYDTVILGAFGCGAFYNPPELIAEFYKKIIETHFIGAFKKVVFAIVDDGIRDKHNPEGNLKPFQECFRSN